jgi:hypothetical protein
MRFILKGGAGLFFALLMSACVTPEKVANSRPAWIDNPGNGVSASAGFHVGGRVAQEELAVLRGRTAYAKGMGVNIQSQQVSTTQVTNDHVSTSGVQQTYEDTNQKDVKVVIKEKWRDVDNDTLWVWLVPTNSQ